MTPPIELVTAPMTAVPRPEADALFATGSPRTAAPTLLTKAMWKGNTRP